MKNHLMIYLKARDGDSLFQQQKEEEADLPFWFYLPTQDHILGSRHRWQHPQEKSKCLKQSKWAIVTIKLVGHVSNPGYWVIFELELGWLHITKDKWICRQMIESKPYVLQSDLDLFRRIEFFLLHKLFGTPQTIHQPGYLPIITEFDNSKWKNTSIII